MGNVRLFRRAARQQDFVRSLTESLLLWAIAPAPLCPYCFRRQSSRRSFNILESQLLTASVIPPKASSSMKYDYESSTCPCLLETDGHSTKLSHGDAVLYGAGGGGVSGRSDHLDENREGTEQPTESAWNHIISSELKFTSDVRSKFNQLCRDSVMSYSCCRHQ